MAEIEKLYQIQGTDIAFSSKPMEFDIKALEALQQANQMGLDSVEVCDGKNLRYKEPQELPGELFLTPESAFYPRPSYVFCRPKGEWKRQGSSLGCMHPTDLTFSGMKEYYVYHEGNRKTNWVMIIYSTIHENSFMKTQDIGLCHVFRSDNYYDPPTVNRIFYISAGFVENEVDSRVAELGSLLEGPKGFKGFHELDERCRVATAVTTNGNKRKRSKAWERFTEIQVRGPNGVVVSTLAICNHCSMVYVTGKWGKNKKGEDEFRNHGTKTLSNHDCSGQQHHVAGKAP